MRSRQGFAVPATALRVVAAFSGVSRALVDTGYNARVEECREAERCLLELGGCRADAASVLSDVEAELFEETGDRLAAALRRRRFAA